MPAIRDRDRLGLHRARQADLERHRRELQRHLPECLRAVLALVAQGLSDDEIAAKLTITRNTVRNHVSAIYKRLDIRKRSAVVVCV